MAWVLAAFGRPPGKILGALGRTFVQAQAQIYRSVVRPLPSATRSHATTTTGQTARFKTLESPRLHSGSDRHNSGYRFHCFPNAINGAKGRPQPIINRSTCKTGMQSARNFSSSQPVFGNIVNNAPLLARALAQELLDGSDTRKRRKLLPLREMVRAKRPLSSECSIGSFGSAGPLKSAFATEASVPSCATLDMISEADTSLLFQAETEVSTSAFVGVHLQLLVEAEPEMPERISEAIFADTSSRLLNRSALHALQDWQTINLRHCKRVNNLIDRLIADGGIVHGHLLVDSDCEFGPQNVFHRKRRFVFDIHPAWDRQRLETALRFWLGGALPSWIQVVDWNEIPSESDNDIFDLFSSVETSDTLSSSSSNDRSADRLFEDAIIHDETAHSLQLPRIGLSSSFESDVLSQTSSREDVRRFIESIDTARGI